MRNLIIGNMLSLGGERVLKFSELQLNDTPHTAYGFGGLNKARRTREQLAELTASRGSLLSYVFSPHTLGKLLNNNIIDKIICIFLHFVPSHMKKLWFVTTSYPGYFAPQEQIPWVRGCDKP
jgi:hypothetical protein